MINLEPQHVRIAPRPDLTGARGASARAAISFDVARLLQVNVGDTLVAVQ